MDRSQHHRYLAYLKKYEYFGRGRPRLSADTFLAVEGELATIEADGQTDSARRRELSALLLRD